METQSGFLFQLATTQAIWAQGAGALHSPLPVTFLEEDVEVINEKAAVTKRMRYLKVRREHLKKRWLTEHVHALEERQRKVFNDVLITDYSKIKSKWRNGRIVEVIRARDRVVRGHKIKTGTGYIIERPLQLVCNLEINGSTRRTCRQRQSDNSSDNGSNETPPRKAK